MSQWWRFLWHLSEIVAYRIRQKWTQLLRYWDSATHPCVSHAFFRHMPSGEFNQVVLVGGTENAFRIDACSMLDFLQQNIVTLHQLTLFHKVPLLSAGPFGRFYHGRVGNLESTNSTKGAWEKQGHQDDWRWINLWPHGCLLKPSKPWNGSLTCAKTQPKIATANFWPWEVR